MVSEISTKALTSFRDIHLIKSAEEWFISAVLTEGWLSSFVYVGGLDRWLWICLWVHSFKYIHTLRPEVHTQCLSQLLSCFETMLLSEPGIHQLPRLANWQAPETGHWPPHLQGWDFRCAPSCLDFCVGAELRIWNSGPHTYLERLYGKLITSQDISPNQKTPLLIISFTC